MTEPTTQQAPAPPPTFPLTRRSALDPPPEYTAGPSVRKVGLYDGRTAWLVTGYDEVREVLASSQVSADRRNPDFPFSSPSREALERADPSFVAFDDPDHARIRRVFTRYFAVRRIAGYRPAVTEIVHELIDELSRSTPPVDLVQNFAVEVPARTICHVLGIPRDERSFFQELDGRRNTLTTAPDAVREATGQMLGLAERLITEKRRNPGDDLVSELVHSEAVSAITAEELLHAVRLLITAGHETTANMIGLSTLVLLRDRAQWQTLRQHPDKIAATVEELLRYVGIFHISPARIATEDFDLGGERIRAGDGIFPVSAAANRDPDRFADPDRFDLERDARGHVAFGYGIHQCLGQPLARLELSVVLEALTARIPSLRLAIEPEEAEVREYAFLKLAELPITWDTIEAPDRNQGARR